MRVAIAADRLGDKGLGQSGKGKDCQKRLEGRQNHAIGVVVVASSSAAAAAAAALHYFPWLPVVVLLLPLLFTLDTSLSLKVGVL